MDIAAPEYVTVTGAAWNHNRYLIENLESENDELRQQVEQLENQLTELRARYTALRLGGKGDD